MTNFQKIIKYGAIAFAIYLCITIIGMIVFGITILFGIGSGMEIFQNDTKNTAMITKWEQEYTNITNLEIDLSVCQLKIKKGNTLKVDVSNVSDEFKCEVQGNKLEISDKKVIRNFWGMNDIKSEVTIYIPETIKFEEINIETGVNETEIESLKAENMKLEIGVGKCNINELSAQDAKIKLGAGETVIHQAKIESLKLEGGIGRLDLKSKIIEKAEIHCGIGKMELGFLGKKEDYKIKAETGLGNFKVEGQKISDESVIGSGNAMIEIEAGIGEVTVEFEKDLVED